MRPRSHLVLPASFENALRVAGFLRLRQVWSGAPRGSLCSFLFVWMRSEGRWVHVCFVLLRPVVAGFFRVRLVHPGAPWWSLVFFRDRLVHQGTPWGSLGSFGFVSFVQERAWGHWCRSG